MSAEALAVKVGTAIASRAIRLLLAKQQHDQETRQDMDALIRRYVPGLRVQRSVRRQFEQIADAVAVRLEPLLVHEFRDLDDDERAVVVASVSNTLEQADLSDAAIFRSNVDAGQLARRLQEAITPPAGLSEAGIAFYNELVAECCEYYVQIIRHLPVFTERAVTELISRVDDLGTDLARVIERLPRRSLYAPDGTDHDADFGREYLDLISNTLDDVELFSFATETPPRTRLSVAYISLRVTTGALPLEARNERPETSEAVPSKPHVGKRRVDDEPGGVRVETALSHKSRILLRGEAGSGKTTLLRWLAITAARGAFTGDLTSWNGLVPVLIRLRRYSARGMPTVPDLLDDTAGSLTGHMPRAWVDRQLVAGRALLLIDGVDELLPYEREGVREWIELLLNSYPDIRMIVTSRPVAVDEDWLVRADFTSVFFERMSTDDLRAFVRQWHQAVGASGQDLPCSAEELPQYERALIASIQDRPHLHALAANPLLAAMVCSLHLIRFQQLPRNRMELYQIAIELMVQRRDSDRRVPSAHDVQLSLTDKVTVLRDLAWRLSDNNLSELDIDRALEYVADKLVSMRHLDVDAVDVVSHLLNRSGILRSPAVDRVDFVHRTFQEYLAAAEAAAQDRIGNLLGRAKLDVWRDSIILAAGHANMRQREELINGLLNRANHSARNARQLRLLAASCLETMESLSEALAQRLDEILAGLIPPHNYDHAVSLAAVGEPVLRKLPQNLDDIGNSSAAAATVHCAALIGGPEALGLLRSYAGDQRWEVHDALAEVWHNFDPVEYSDRVLSGMPAHSDLDLLVRHTSQLEPAIRLGNIAALTIECPTNLGSLEFDHLPEVLALKFRQLMGINDLSHLTGIPRPDHLRTLSLSAADDEAEMKGYTALGSFAGLSELHLHGWKYLPALSEIPIPRQLHSLGLGLVPSGSRLDFLGESSGLSVLTLAGAEAPPALITMPRMAALQHLWLLQCDLTAYLSDILAVAPMVETLHLLEVTLPDDLAVLAGLPQLRELEFKSCVGVRGGRVNLLSITRPEPLAPLQITIGNTPIFEPSRGLLHTGRVTVRHNSPLNDPSA